MDDLVKRADEALKGVTPGPWTVKYDLGDTCLMMNGDCQMCDTTYYPWTPSNVADWHFIAAARELVPLMRDRIEADAKRIADLALDALAAQTQAAEAYQAQLVAEARVKELEAALDKLPEYLVAFERENSFRLGQVQGFIYGDDCVVRDCWHHPGEQEVLRKPASEISHDEMMDFIHAYRLRLAIRAALEGEKT